VEINEVKQNLAKKSFKLVGAANFEEHRRELQFINFSIKYLVQVFNVSLSLVFCLLAGSWYPTFSQYPIFC